MKKRLFLTLILAMALIMTFGLAGCGGSDEEATPAGAAYGYAGDDEIELAAYKYMVEEIGGRFDEADVSIPTVTIFYEDLSTEGEATVYGDFWLDKYNIEDDTLVDVSGGHFPGVMHMTKGDEGYTVTAFDEVESGSNFDESAKALYGEYYDQFAQVSADDEARAELRTITVSDYVKMNGLSVTKYQDEGWDPVDLILE